MSYKITASSVSEYNETEKKLKKLPKLVLAQIEFAEKIHSKIHCSFKKSFDETINIVLPNEINDIEIGEVYIVAYNQYFRFSKNKTQQQVVRITLINQ